ncbi:hypothetical protein B0H11DRAFT_2234131 [Mycena galericulata]|nr:hypothetical protein B0H11DRAFT_2234131 [Mycena galericulata]
MNLVTSVQQILDLVNCGPLESTQWIPPNWLAIMILAQSSLPGRIRCALRLEIRPFTFSGDKLTCAWMPNRPLESVVATAAARDSASRFRRGEDARRGGALYGHMHASLMMRVHVEYGVDRCIRVSASPSDVLPAHRPWGPLPPFSNVNPQTTFVDLCKRIYGGPLYVIALREGGEADVSLRMEDGRLLRGYHKTQAHRSRMPARR